MNITQACDKVVEHQDDIIRELHEHVAQFMGDDMAIALVVNIVVGVPGQGESAGVTIFNCLPEMAAETLERSAPMLRTRDASAANG